MRISDWSSDVCSSDLATTASHRPMAMRAPGMPVSSRSSENSQADTTAKQGLANSEGCSDSPAKLIQRVAPLISDRKSVVSGKSVSVRLDLGGRRIIKKKNKKKKQQSTSYKIIK